MRRTVTPVSFSRSAMTGPSVWPSYGLPCSALACSTNCPPLGAVTGVAIETLQPNSYGARALPRPMHSTSGVQRVDLWPALTLLLMPNTKRESEQWAKAVFEHCVALDLAANVTDDAAKPRAQKLQFPPGAFELVGMRVAPHHDGGPLGHPQIALAQLNALALGQLHQLLDRAVGKPGIGRMCDRLLLHGGIHRHPLEIFGRDRPAPVCH